MTEREESQMLCRCRRLLKIALRQRQALAEDDLEALSRLQQEREQIMEAWPLGLVADAGEEAEVAACIQQIVAIDKENEVMIRARIARLKEELRELRGGRRVLEGYRPALPPGGDARFINRQA